MADQLATPSDLAAALQSNVDTATATLLIECATSVVQEAAGGQRIIQVVDDTATLIGVSDAWLDLPQIPVTAVGAVTLDGTAVAAGVLTTDTQYKRFGDRLWRGRGWQVNCGVPSEVVVVNTHGYPPGAQELQRARHAVLSLCAAVYANPDGATSVHIDDYSAAYEAMSARMEASKFLKAALRRQYGRRAGLVRIG
jgi:hypothetical protein